MIRHLCCRFGTLILTLLLALASCTPNDAHDGLIVHFQIPVRDMDRAVRFYRQVLGFEFHRQTVDGYEMARFAPPPGAPGIPGSLAKGDVYVPAKTGPLIYFAVRDVSATLARANASGAKTLYPRTVSGPGRIVAEFEDSEGNRIGIQSKQ